MSQTTYSKRWASANESLNRMLRMERPKKVKPLSPDREICFADMSVRYIKYVLIYTSLQNCYDHMIHPQKRILLAKCLEGVSGRIIEFHTELVRLKMSEYINLVDVCMDLKIVPEDLELKLIKANFDRVKELRQRTQFLEYILETMGDKEKVETGSFYTVEEAILLIQRNERAFRARRKASVLKNRKTFLRRVAKYREVKDLRVEGIIKFQALWKKYRIRKMIGDIRRQNDLFLGMTMPVYKDLKVKDAEIKQRDIERAQINEDFMIKDMILKSEEYMDSRGASVADNMKREIMAWILEYRDLMGSFPQFPTEEEGGSLAIFSRKTVEEVEQDIEDMMEATKAKGGNGKDKTQEKDKKKEGNSEDKAKGPKPYKPMPSQFIDQVLFPCAEEYGKFWMNRDDSNNRKQRYDKTLLMEDVRANVEGIIRKQVDELIREELVKLEKAVDEKKPPKPKAKKEKKDGKKKKKGAKKDPTAGVPLEDLYKELVLAGVIRMVPKVNLHDFVGMANLMSPLDSETVDNKHDLGDVRKMIFDYAILPMSSEVIHRRAPYKKSILIVGPRGSGKRMLVHAICTTLGANLIDLSPDNIDGKYQGSVGQKRLIHLVTKIGKQMEPSVIFINHCDRMFTKKLPPEDTTNPGRLKRDMMKLLKGITPDDRILIVGSTTYPFKAALGPLFKLYERMIFIYPPCSRSRFAIWRKFILDSKGILHDKFDLTSLTRVSRGYTANVIKHAIMEVLTEKRLRRQSALPLSTKEFVLRLSTFDPVYQEELDEFEAWLLKTPLKKKLQKVLLMESEGQDVGDIL